MKAIYSLRVNDVGELPRYSVCGVCRSPVVIDWDASPYFEGGHLLVLQRCPVCASTVANAVGSPEFIDFVSSRI